MTTHPSGSSPDGSRWGPLDRRTEKRLAASMRKHQRAARESAFGLIHLYATHRQDESARAVALLLITAHMDPGARAVECLELGVRMEEASCFDLAAWAYAAGIACEPTDTDLWYWLSNNLGFALNQTGRHAASEPHCRAAIRCDSGRHNAHKNLGVALEGQGRIAEAARSYVSAVRAEPGDVRSARHLALLAQGHLSELEQKVPEALRVLDEFRGVLAALDAPSPRANRSHAAGAGSHEDAHEPPLSLEGPTGDDS